MKKLLPLSLLLIVCACSSPEDRAADAATIKIHQWLEGKYNAVGDLEFSGENIRVSKHKFDENWDFFYTANVSCQTMLGSKIEYQCDTVTFGGVYDPNIGAITLDSYSSIKPRFK